MCFNRVFSSCRQSWRTRWRWAAALWTARTRTPPSKTSPACPSAPRRAATWRWSRPCPGSEPTPRSARRRSARPPYGEVSGAPSLLPAQPQRLLAASAVQSVGCGASPLWHFASFDPPTTPLVLGEEKQVFRKSRSHAAYCYEQIMSWLWASQGPRERVETERKALIQADKKQEKNQN